MQLLRSGTFALATLVAGAAWADASHTISQSAQNVSRVAASDVAALQGEAADCRPFVIQGTAHSKGLDGRFLIAADPRKQTATLQVTGAGPADFAFGVAGSQAWVKDANGVITDADFDGYRAGLISDAYWLSGGISNPCWPAKVEALRTEQVDGITADVLDVLPLGGKATKVWISRATHLPLRWSRRDEPDVATTTYADYRRVGNRRMPFRQRMVDRDGNAWDLRDVTVRTDVAPDLIAEQVKKPAVRLNDYWIDGGNTTTMSMGASGAPRVSVFINGKGPFTFMFDSGGALSITRATADAAGLKLFGDGRDTGVTGAAVRMRFSRIGDLRIGDAHLRDQYVSVSDSGSAGGSAQIAGFIGYEVLARFVTTFDFPHRTVSLSLTHDAAPAGASSASSMMLDHTVPTVAGAINGVTDYFWLDTGFDGALLVNRPFTVAHPAAVPAKLYDIGTQLSGVGGSDTVKLGRIHAVSIGAATFTNAIGMFSSSDGGLNSDVEFAADVGDGLFASSVVTFDYLSRRIWIGQVDGPGVASAVTYNRAGFGLDYVADSVATVSYVREDSPAAEVGLRVGDHVIEIDGGSVSGQVVADFKKNLRMGNDSPITLTVLRSGGVTEVVVRPRDYVQ